MPSLVGPAPRTVPFYGASVEVELYISSSTFTMRVTAVSHENDFSQILCTLEPLRASTLGEEFRAWPPMRVMRRRERREQSHDGWEDIFLVRMYLPNVDRLLEYLGDPLFCLMSFPL